MVLMAIVGELGSGKTLALTYFAWRNWKRKKRKVYANYKLAFPYIPVRDIEDLINMGGLEEEVFFAGDELWLWVDCRTSISVKNRLVNQILLSSRKKNIHIAFTAQSFSQCDVRLRNICDLIARPVFMDRENKICKIIICPNPPNKIIDQKIFYAPSVWNLYDTREVIMPLEFHGMDEELKKRKQAEARKKWKERNKNKNKK